MTDVDLGVLVHGLMSIIKIRANRAQLSGYSCANSERGMHFIAFSSEVGTGSRQENASKQEPFAAGL
jgi:5-carboxymethyl-2-hydroxymuconate isomerase